VTKSTISSKFGILFYIKSYFDVLIK